MIDINAAVRFLRSIGVSASKQTVLEFELMVFKGLEFSLTVINPLTYVEILLEVLGKRFCSTHTKKGTFSKRLYVIFRNVYQRF